MRVSAAVLCGLILLSQLFPGATAHAGEVIERFQSDLQVAPDGTMQVIETITVIAEGQAIKRGIYRDFPTVYRDRFNHRVQVRFEVLQVRRGGKDEPWFIKDTRNGKRVYIGRKDAFIDKGRHRYEITYRTNRQLGFFAKHDELYWNVTGNDWAFPIEQVIAYVYLPKSVPASSIAGEAYTGGRGAKGVDYESAVDGEGVAWFRTTRSLGRGEGLTIVTSWPKGHVREPTIREHVQWLLQDNGRVLAGVIGSVLLLCYYLLAWLRLGRDPQSGVLVPHYEPPKNYSPASMRFVQRMDYDAKTFAAALVNLAANGHVRIEQRNADFVIARDQSSAPMAAGEKALLNALLGGRQQLSIQRSARKAIKKAMDAHKLRLQADYEKKYFATNYVVTLIGIGISVAVMLTALLWAGADDKVRASAPFFSVVLQSAVQVIAPIFLMVWLSGWSYALFTTVSKMISIWRQMGDKNRLVMAIGGAVFTLPFVGAWVVGAHALVQMSSLGVAVLAAFLIGINLLFYQLMKAPTVCGRALLDRIEGFREYLVLAEADELRLRHPPARTPELFEKLLPYAIALDVEDVWGERFESVLASAQQAQGYSGPKWYSGPVGGQAVAVASASEIASRVGGALARSISASSQAPGSSSGRSSGGGSSGGGSSGGGGGGGGGGGW